MASVQINIDNQNSRSWNHIVSQFSDASLYQTWAYGSVRWHSSNLSHFVMTEKNQVLSAAQLRIIQLPFSIGGIAYLRWGPLCQRNDHALDPFILQETMKYLRDEYCGRRKLMLQITPNAFVNDPRGMAFEKAFIESNFQPQRNLPGYRTFLLDLQPCDEIIRKNLSQKWRNQLNRSEKNNLQLEVSDSGKAFTEFRGLYSTMWEKKRFKTSVNVQEFSRIQDRLAGPEKMLIFLAKYEHKYVAALICSLMGETALYVLGATNQKARELKASYFLHWQAIQWLKERGARWYDLGGINPRENPGGFHFKKGFNGKDVTQLPIHSFSDGRVNNCILHLIDRRYLLPRFVK